MQPWAAEKSRGMKNIDDPTVHCFMPGIPRVVGMPFPLEIVQTPNKIVIYEAFRTFRVIPTDGKKLPGEGIASYNGDSVGHWEGDTLVVDVTNFNGKIWGPGQMKVTSDKYHVVERYTLNGDTIAYEAVIEDPGVMTGPFVSRSTLRRIRPRLTSWNTSAWRTTSTSIRSFSRRLKNRSDKEGGQQGCCQEIETEDLLQPLGRRSFYKRLHEGHGDCQIQQSTGSAFSHHTGRNHSRP